MSQGAPQNPLGHMTALPPGYVLEGYRIERMLGEGGFGITYLGVDTQIGRRVAIKELLPKEFATRTHGSQVVPYGTHTVDAFTWALDSFMNEARTLASLSHPNVVQIQRLFRTNGTAYMVMDYVDGQSMKEWLKALPGPPNEAQLRGILMPLLDGLEHVHEAGLLHRDIKPDNIFITARGNPVLLDFGSARVDVGRTQTMTSLVSEGYSPVEQYQKKARQSPATDLYALAGSMVRAITGEPPPTAIDRSMDASLQAPLATTHRGRYSAAFLSAIDAAFAVHAAQRPQSVAAWRGMLAGERQPATPPPHSADGAALPSASPGTSSTPKRQPGWFLAATATLIAIGVGAGIYITLSHGGNTPTESTPAPVDRHTAAGSTPALVTPPATVPISTPAPPQSALDDGEVGRIFEVELPGNVKMAFCFCPPGEFLMGSPATEEERSYDEEHVSVKFKRGYWMAQTEVTQAQWEKVMGGSPSAFKGANLPVEYVSWDEAQSFVEKLNAQRLLPAGWSWTLPSEAQWEYACRAGTTTAFHFGDTLNGKEANCDGSNPYGTKSPGSYLEKTVEAGSYRPNAWGLHDMHGNVSEWCSDWYTERYEDALAGQDNPHGTGPRANRVSRGGSWYSSAIHCRSAYRNRLTPGNRGNNVGFRVALVRTVP